MVANVGSSGKNHPGKPGLSSVGSARAARLLRKLTPAQLAGQRVIYSYKGTVPPASLLWEIAHGQAAGVIFFTGNITSQAQLAGVVRTLDQANNAATNPVHLPLLLMTDQEGGLVRRLQGLAPALSEKQIGASANAGTQATLAGSGAAATLRGAGLNVNLAPVLDVFRAPGNFIDEFQRSYGSNPALVARLGADFVTAQQRGRVAATVKHFPGLGAATRPENTDLRPVTLHLSLAAVRGTDELPYKSAIAAGVKLVMLSWAVYPALDPVHPAGLSSAIVQGELRQRLGFTGVTITDALEAGALQPLTIPQRSFRAAKAGMDLLLCAAGNVPEGQQALAALKAGYLNGTLGTADFQAAVQRIMVLRQSVPA
jgi:beta-N-acetylhexosaminidase